MKNNFELMSVEESENGKRIDVKVGHSNNPQEIYFESNSVPLDFNLDTFLVLSLLPSMKSNSNMSLGGEISSTLLNSSREIQNIYMIWRY